MENVIPIIIWVVIVCVIRSIAKKATSQKNGKQRPTRQTSQPPMDLPPELLELLQEAAPTIRSQVKPPAPKPRVSQAKSRKPVVASSLKTAESHAGESYASPIPDPYTSPMIGKETPSQRHAASHIGPVAVKDTLKKHGPSATAKHADEHIATTHAVPTPQSGAPRKSPLADWIPRGEKDLRKALVMSEILGAPKSLR